LERHATNGALLTAADLGPYPKGGELPEPAVGEAYNITPGSELNSARRPVRSGRSEAGTRLAATNL